MNRLQRTHEVSIWLHTLSRELLESGEFATLVDKYAVSVATSNPTIFAKAITGSERYDKQLRSLDLAGGSPRTTTTTRSLPPRSTAFAAASSTSAACSSGCSSLWAWRGRWCE